MEDENKKVIPASKEENGDQSHEDDQDENDNNQDQNDDDQNNDDADEGEETVESLKAKNAKLQEAYENQKKRAEKAENKSSDNKDNKKVVDTKKTSKADDLTPKDLYALMENKVPKEDVDDVVQYARFSKISIDDALDSDFVKRLLADKSEKRATARATNIGYNRRGSGKVSEQALLQKASQSGEIPDDDADLDRLIDARLEQKRQKASNKK